MDVFSVKSFLAALPVLPWNDYSPGSIKGGVFASVSETFPLRKSIMLLWQGWDHKGTIIHLMKVWSSPFLLFCISPAEELPVQDAFGVENGIFTSSAQPARGCWCFLQHWQLLWKHSASQVCSWAAAASRICGKEHREGVDLPFWDTRVALLSGFSAGCLSGCVSANLLCSFQVGRDYPPSCCRDCALWVCGTAWNVLWSIIAGTGVAFLGMLRVLSLYWITHCWGEEEGVKW